MKSIFIIFLFVLLCSLFAQAARTVVIIDPGHGGSDKGGNLDKYYEKHLTLDTAYRVKALLDMRGVPNVMIRDNDYFPSLAQRVKQANRYSRAIYVSIHYNYTKSSSVRGIETFYFGGSSRSYSLANSVHYSLLNRVYANNRKVKTAKFYVLKHTRHPAILVEGGFLSNKKEREAISKGAYRQALAEGIVDGICSFLGYKKRQILLQ